MIRINLLPFRTARKKENARRQISIFVMSLVLVLAACVGYYLYLSNQIKDLEGKIKDTRAQIEKFKKINEEIAAIKKRLDLLNQKIKIIQTLEATRKGPVELLRDVSDRVVEKQMWIKKIDERDGNIEVMGIAIDDPAVAAYMTRLESTPGYVDVKLVSIQRDTSVKGVILKQFHIRFRQEPRK